MKHAREDYDRFQDPALERPDEFPGVNPIGADEPVFLLRARDTLAPMVVNTWARELHAAGGNPRTVARVQAFADKMAEWQRENGAKLPDYAGDEIDEQAEAGARDAAGLVMGQRVRVPDGREGFVMQEHEPTSTPPRYDVRLDDEEGTMIVQAGDVELIDEAEDETPPVPGVVIDGDDDRPQAQA